MNSSYDRQLKNLEDRLRAVERREREMDRKLSQFNALMRDQGRDDVNAYRDVINELSHLDRQISMLATRAEDQLTKLDLDREDFSALIGDVGGINTSASSLLGQVSTVDSNVSTALSSIELISQDVESVLENQTALSEEITTAQQTANQALTEANSANSTAGQTQQDLQDVLDELEGSGFTESFIGSTPVETSRGHVHIRNIKPGSRIFRPLGYGAITRLALETVLETPQRAVVEDHLIKVVISKQISLIGTRQHRVAVMKGDALELVRIGDLDLGDRLVSYQHWGRLGFRVLRPVRALLKVRGFREVYNLHLPHRQFLIDGGVLAH